jgi:beta-lactamase class A
MKNTQRILVCLVFLIFITGCKSSAVKTELKNDISKLIENKKLDIGVSVRDDSGNEIISINNDKKYKLYSVSKYFLGVYLLHLVDEGKLNLEQPVKFSEEELRPKLYSPLRDSIPQGVNLSLKQSLKYLIKDSDNHVFDKLADVSGGLEGLNSFICKLAPCQDNFVIKSLYRDPDGTIGYNVITPSMASYILNKVNNEKVLSDKSFALLKGYMANSANHKRIQGLIADKTRSFHKSGTSDRVNGIRLVTNDIGIVNLKNGKSFSIAVFISNSLEDDETNDYLIAKITDMVYSRLND